MSTPNFPSPKTPAGSPAPPMPPGWLANWSPEHNAWYYVLTATGETQWEYPLSKFAKSIVLTGAGAVGAKIIGRIWRTQQSHPHVFQTVIVPGAPPYYGQSSPGGQNYGPPSPGGQNYEPPSPGGQNYGQLSPGGQNYGQHPPGGHFTAGNATAVAPMAMTPPPHQYEGVNSPPSVGMGAFTAPPNGPPLYIYGAAFADRDVTQIVRSLVTPQQTLTLTGDMLVQKLGDPWPQVERKSFNVLYSYGDRPMELLAAETSTANIEIKNEALSKKRIEFCHKPPSRIIACVWGLENPLTAPRLEQLEKYGEMEGSEAAFGPGGFWPWEPKTLVCYYRTETRGVGIAFCRQGGTVRLPWNHLAKWS